VDALKGLIAAEGAAPSSSDMALQELQRALDEEREARVEAQARNAALKQTVKLLVSDETAKSKRTPSKVASGSGFFARKKKSASPQQPQLKQSRVRRTTPTSSSRTPSSTPPRRGSLTTASPYIPSYPFSASSHLKQHTAKSKAAGGGSRRASGDSNPPSNLSR
jgi:hypothetical protein